MDGTRMTFNLDIRPLPAIGLASLSRVSTLLLRQAEPSIGDLRALRNSCASGVVLSSSLRLPSSPSGKIKQATVSGRWDTTKFNWRQEVI